MIQLSSWATLVAAFAFVGAALYIHHLSNRPLKTCQFCGGHYRSPDVYVIDQTAGVLGVCCSVTCADAMSESIRLGQP